MRGKGVAAEPDGGDPCPVASFCRCDWPRLCESPCFASEIEASDKRSCDDVEDKCYEFCEVPRRSLASGSKPFQRWKATVPAGRISQRFGKGVQWYAGSITRIYAAA